MSTSHDSPYRHYLKEWREHRGLNQEQLGKIVRISSSVISRFETGERHMKLEVQFKFMVALRITPAQFFSSPDAPNLSALVSLVPPEDVAIVAKLVKGFIPDDI